jgi:putative membrane protein
MEENKNATGDHVLTNTDLAFERTSMAESRTLMAWIRTAISMISFGFTIYKFFHDLPGETHKLLNPRTVGMIMIGFGMLALMWGLMEYNATIKRLKKSYPQLQVSKTRMLALLILLFGLVLFLAALFKQ